MMKLLMIGLTLLFSSGLLAKETIAVNVALALPAPLLQKVQSINSKIKQDNPLSFEFDSSHIPHVTLYQVFVEKDQMDSLIEKLSTQKREKIELEVKDLETSKLESAESIKLLNLDLKKTDQVLKLHEEIRKLFLPHRSEEGSQKSFYLSEDVNNQFIEYVKNFDSQSSAGNYSPHITLGLIKNFDREEIYFRPGEKYQFSELIVVQIGNYGTARKILKKINLFPVSKK